MNVQWFSNLANNISTHPAFFVGYLLVLLILSTTIPDIDHPLHYYLGWGEGGRFLHKWFAVAGLLFVGGGIGVLITLYRRLAGH